MWTTGEQHRLEGPPEQSSMQYTLVSLSGLLLVEAISATTDVSKGTQNIFKGNNLLS